LKTSFQKSVHKFIETSSVVGVEPVGIGGFASQKTKMSDDVDADALDRCIWSFGRFDVAVEA
jgi:hypothetical protein